MIRLLSLPIISMYAYSLLGIKTSSILILEVLTINFYNIQLQNTDHYWFVLILKEFVSF